MLLERAEEYLLYKAFVSILPSERNALKGESLQVLLKALVAGTKCAETEGVEVPKVGSFRRDCSREPRTGATCCAPVACDSWPQDGRGAAVLPQAHCRNQFKVVKWGNASFTAQGLG